MKVYKKMLVMVLSLMFSVGYINAEVAVDIAKMERKADHLIQIEEWNSANAIYILLADKCENDVKSYARVIVTSGMLNDEDTQVEMLKRTQQRGISMDSVFYHVNAFAYSVGQSQEYEKFLRLLKIRTPWMSRLLNIRLLKYYNFRNNANSMIEIGNELLATTPDDMEYISVVARGYMLKGNYENAVMSYKRILELDAENFDALVALGNYYYVMWKSAENSRSQMSAMKDDALVYLKKAYSIKETAFLLAVIEELEKFNQVD